MTVIGSQDLAPGVLAVTVDADPTSVAVDAPRGSLITFKPGAGLPVYFTKDDDGPSTNVTLLGGGSAGLIPVSSTTLGAPAATLLIPGFDSSARLWLLSFTKLQPVTNNSSAELEFRLGGVFPVDFLYEDHTQVSAVTQSSYAGTNGIGKGQVDIGGFSAQSNLADRSGQIQVLVVDPGATDERKTIQYSGSTWNTAAPPRLRFIEGRGCHGGLSAALDAMQLSYTAGNIAGGLVVDLYKYALP